MTFSVLFPVDATGGGGQQQLDILSFSNIADEKMERYYAHAVIAWIFLCFVTFMITRETIFCINVRHNYMIAPVNAGKISSKTVLFTFIPEQYMVGAAFREVLGENNVTRVWMAKDCEELTKKVEERDANAIKLENAEIKLIKAAIDRRLKWAKKIANAERKRKPRPERSRTDVETALASEWMKRKDRPTHRIGRMPLTGEKVDTIEWCRDELRRLLKEIETRQNAICDDQADGMRIPAAFVEFENQAKANRAYQAWSARKHPKLHPRAIAVTPNEIIWENLGISRTQRILRVIATATFLTAMIIFWAIPIAVVGSISNINYLTAVPFLSFINRISPVIVGIVTGLLPSVALSLLMALVPVVCRWMGKLSGEVTIPAVELKCQNWYFAFQVIHVFLVTTFSSGAASAAAEIIADPSAATTLLAQSLPKASNFFISYIIVQCLGIAAGDLINIGALVMLTIGGKFLDKSPRMMYNRYITLTGLEWGSLYPKFCCLGVIAISYSCIAPLVLGFATIGFGFMYLAVRYNMFFVLSNTVDTKGLAYAKALQQLMVGVYISELCLIGLFAIKITIGPLVLVSVLLFFTATYHGVMRHALKPLITYIPESTDGDHQVALFNSPANDTYDSPNSSDIPPTESDDRVEKPGYRVTGTDDDETKSNDIPPTESDNRIEKPDSRVTGADDDATESSNTPQTEPEPGNRVVDPEDRVAETEPSPEYRWFTKLFDPRKFKSHARAQDIVPRSQDAPIYEEVVHSKAYLNPAMMSRLRTLWIVRDDMKISQREIEDTADFLQMSNSLATFNEVGDIRWDQESLDQLPIWENKISY
ncbi:hypothetical protein DSL72_001479 [Monilinia vaccinii-corymbosi]|uniref:CSC1/OSCA1-like 7TM region domain-containing protein n=1 Tax=Monilinia vaccinii-corymbosi TaxID=61207 RepID=A0A8A3P4Y1_9HELO|nr:hypothetical protein DSL72_001479 [Monilinia vaccinii-corymbosi]